MIRHNIYTIDTVFNFNFLHELRLPFFMIFNKFIGYCLLVGKVTVIIIITNNEDLDLSLKILNKRFYDVQNNIRILYKYLQLVKNNLFKNNLFIIYC